MNNKRVLTSAIIGLIVVAVTFVLFFVAIDEPQTVHWLAITFIVLAEIAVTGATMLLDSRRSPGVMLRAGTYSAMGIYVVLAMVVSLVFLFGISSSVKWLVALQIVVIALAAIIILPIINTAQVVRDSNRNTVAAVQAVKQLASRVQYLQQSEGGKPYASQLEKVYEAILYSDTNAYITTDSIISDRITQLEQAVQAEEEDRDQRVMALSNEILLLAQRRAAEVKGLKAGDI